MDLYEDLKFRGVAHQVTDEKLGEVLCHDPEFVNRYVHELQAIDLIAQKQRALANVLGAECPVTALDGVGLEEIVTRFKTLAGKLG